MTPSPGGAPPGRWAPPTGAAVGRRAAARGCPPERAADRDDAPPPAELRRPPTRRRRPPTTRRLRATTTSATRASGLRAKSRAGREGCEARPRRGRRARPRGRGGLSGHRAGHRGHRAPSSGRSPATRSTTGRRWPSSAGSTSVDGQPVDVARRACAARAATTSRCGWKPGGVGPAEAEPLPRPAARTPARCSPRIASRPTRRGRSEGLLRLAGRPGAACWLTTCSPGRRRSSWLVLAALIGGLAGCSAGACLRGASTRRGRAGRGRPRATTRARSSGWPRGGGRGRVREALRLRFRAGLLRLDARGAIVYRPSISTREVSRKLRSEDFDALAVTFDDVVYGGRAAEDADVEEARSRWREVVQAMSSRVRFDVDPDRGARGLRRAARGARAPLAGARGSALVVVRDIAAGSRGVRVGAPARRASGAAAAHVGADEAPPTGATLIVLDPDVMEPEEAPAIGDWVRAGGRLVAGGRGRLRLARRGDRRSAGAGSPTAGPSASRCCRDRDCRRGRGARV